MKIEYNNVYFYPFSGLNSTDFENILELITNHDNVNKFTLIFCDIFNYDPNLLKEKIFKILCFIGNNNFDLNNYESSKIRHILTNKKNSELNKLIHDQYGWSEKRVFNFESFNFSKNIQNNVLVEFELIIPVMDSFNFFDFFLKDNINHMSNFNLILQNPGQVLNSCGLDIFNILDDKKLIKRAFISNVNEFMQLPDNYQLLSLNDNFKIYQNTSYNVEVSLKLSKIASIKKKCFKS